jgi:hypothetical protein
MLYIFNFNSLIVPLDFSKKQKYKVVFERIEREEVEKILERQGSILVEDEKVKLNEGDWGIFLTEEYCVLARVIPDIKF